MEANLAKKRLTKDNSKGEVRGRIFWAGSSSGGKALPNKDTSDDMLVDTGSVVSKASGEESVIECDGVSGQDPVKVKAYAGSACGVDRRTKHHSAHASCAQENGVHQSITDTLSSTFYDNNNSKRSNPNLHSGNRISVNTYTNETDIISDMKKLFMT